MYFFKIFLEYCNIHQILYILQRIYIYLEIELTLLFIVKLFVEILEFLLFIYNNNMSTSHCKDTTFLIFFFFYNMITIFLKYNMSTRLYCICSF